MNDLVNKLDWEVQEMSLSTETGIEVPYKVLMRSDNQEVLSVKTGVYTVFTNAKFQALIDKIVDFGGFSFEGYQEFNGGKKILAFLKNTNSNYRLCGYKVNEYLIVGNSNDGSSKLFIGTSNFMHRCKNQFTEKIRCFEQRHTVDLDLENVDLRAILKEYEDARKHLYFNMQQLSMIKVHNSDIDMMVKHVLKLNESRDLEVMTDLKQPISAREQSLRKYIYLEMKELGQTYWGLFNGVTKYTSTELKGGFGNTRGTAARINSTAYDVCLKRLSNSLFMVNYV